MESSDGSIQSKASSEATTPTNGQDKKPFTYTPGGLDLSEIKSETMAKRLLKNAMNPGVQEVPRTANRSGSLPSGPPLHSYNLTSVPVLPNIQLPADPKSLLRQTSGPTNSSEVIDRILDDSIPFEIREEKKVNGSIIEGTPIVKNGTKESEEVETTVTINQTIRRNSEKLESSVEEVIEKLKMSLEEANKNLERVDTNDTKTKNNESYDEVSEEEVEEEVEEEEGDEEEEEVVESVTIVRKSAEQPKVENEKTVQKSKVNGQHDSEEEIEEEEEEEDGEEVVEEVKKTTTVVKTTVTKQEEEEEEEEEEVEEEEEAEYEEAVSNPSPQPPPKEETEQSIDPDTKEVVDGDEEKEAVAEDEENQSLKKEIKEENVEISNHSSKRSSIDATVKEEPKNETESVEIPITHKNEETEVKIEPREEQSERQPSPLRNINARLGELQNLPALDISSKRFSFLRESEERVHEYSIKTSTDSQDYTPSRQVRNVSPAYKTSQYQSPAFEKPIQKSYHPPPPSGVPKIFPQTQTQNVQREYQYAPQTQYQYQQPTQYYQQEQAQPYQAPTYQAPQRVQEYQTYPSQQYQTPAPVQEPQRAQEYRSTQDYHSTETHTSQQYQPYYTESLTSHSQKQVEILPPWKTEETSQQPGNYAYENKPSFYGTGPTQKIEPPWKPSYAPPTESFSKPVSNSTTGVLNPLLHANKRNSWLQQTSIEQEVSDPFSDPEPVWKRELREMATKPNDYYSDDIEPKVEVEQPWRRELREFSQRNNPQQDEPRLEPQSDEPPWMKEVKFRLTTYTQPEVPASNWQTQTMRPKTWREKSANLERARSIEAPEWQKPNTLNRPRPLSTYTKSHLEPTTYLDTKTRGASMDRDTSRLARPYQSSASNTSSHYSNGYSLPWEVSSNDSPMLSPTPHQYDRTPTPQSSSSPYRPPQQQQYTGYTQSPSSTNREYATLSYQPRGRNPNRTWPVQSRSFRYLQILTGTHDGYEDDEPFVAQAPLQSLPKPRPGPY